MEKSLKELKQIPGVGSSIAIDLYNLGIRSIEDLKDKDPQVLYDTLCNKAGSKMDRCLLYTFRCAVYFASNTKHDPNLLKWWNWKDSRKNS